VVAIVLLSFERLSVQDVARQAGGIQPAFWRWQQRFAEESVEGLLRDNTRPLGTPLHSTRTKAKMLALTCSEPPDEVMHWTGRRCANRHGTIGNFVCGLRVEHPAAMARVKRSPKMTANYALAMTHSRGSIFQGLSGISFGGGHSRFDSGSRWHDVKHPASLTHSWKSSWPAPILTYLHHYGPA
jgi:hypothetical protein